MDLAYDHIQEELLPQDEEAKPEKVAEPTSLNNEIQDAYKAISSSPWATRLGGFFGSVKKQGEHYYEEARQEYNQASEQAAKGFSSIVNRTRTLSLNQSESSPIAAVPTPTPSTTISAAVTDEQQPTTQPSSITTENVENAERPESLPADIVREAESMLSKFRVEATKRLKDIEKAEDAADEALYKFGTNIRNFLRDAVTVVPPSANSSTDDLLNNPSSTVIFESKDAEGKRVLHTTRFDAQLHAIHSNAESFLKDPDSPEYAGWVAEFDVEEQTEAIANDLQNYEKLKRAMERLVPEQVEYGQFWKRYYFLRHVVEMDERRRKELLKGATTTVPAEEEVSWDNDSSSDDEDGVAGADKNNKTNKSGSDGSKTPNQTSITPTLSSQQNQPPQDLSPPSSSSPFNSTPKTATAAAIPTFSATSNMQLRSDRQTDDNDDQATLLKPAENGRKHSNTSTSNDQHSQADSDASYDLISGATSGAPGSPRETRESAGGVLGGGAVAGGKAGQTMAVATTAAAAATTTEDSDEDWE